jgi:4-hydroxybenzoate polyprenyltransferase
MVGSLCILGELTAQPTPYFLGLFGVAAHLAWQITTVDINNGKDCWEKFKSNAWIGPIFLTGIILANLIKRKDKRKEQIVVN